MLHGYVGMIGGFYLILIITKELYKNDPKKCRPFTYRVKTKGLLPRVMAEQFLSKSREVK